MRVVGAELLVVRRRAGAIGLAMVGAGIVASCGLAFLGLAHDPQPWWIILGKGVAGFVGIFGVALWGARRRLGGRRP